MAKGVPNRSTKPGKTANAGNKGPVVGYGDKGKAFHSQKNYNQSKSGQAHAKNPALSVKPVGKGKQGNVFFSTAKFNASKSGPMATKTHGPIALSSGQQAHMMTAEAAKPAPKIAAHVNAMPKSIMRAPRSK